MTEHLPARVRAGEAMRLLGIRDRGTFYKVVDACPQVKHRLPGETQDRYLTAEILKLLTPQMPGPRCASGGGEHRA